MVTEIYFLLVDKIKFIIKITSKSLTNTVKGVAALPNTEIKLIING